MGYHYSLWNIYDKASEIENKLINDGVIPQTLRPFSSQISKKNSLLIPVLAHGFYDFCCTINSTWATVVFYAFIIFLYFHCFKKIKQMSTMDNNDVAYAIRLVSKKYPKVILEEKEETFC